MCLFPITYAVHIFDEWWADFPQYLLRTEGVQLSNTKFLMLQLSGLVLMIIGVVLSRRFGFPNQMLAILTSIVLGNSFIHLARSYLGAQYEPGLLSSVVIWIPLGIYTLFKLWKRMSLSRYLVGTLIGIAICFAVEIIPL